jgi:hypothetical protein
MQYNIGYKLPNLIDVFLHTEGTYRRYEKVYERSIKLYKEVDNTFTLVVRNQDQKAQFVNNTTTVLQISDSDNNLKLTKVGTVLDDGSSTATKGHIKFTITESDMLSLDKGYYHGAIKHTGSDSVTSLIYADTRYDAAVRFEVVGETFPELTDSIELKSFSFIDDEWVSSSVDSKPNKNSNTALHTVAYYLTSFTGSIKVYGTLNTNSSYATQAQQSDFYLIDTKSYDDVSGIKYVNFNGVHQRISIVAQASDSSTVLTGLDKVLYRS